MQTQVKHLQGMLQNTETQDMNVQVEIQLGVLLNPFPDMQATKKSLIIWH